MNSELIQFSKDFTNISYVEDCIRLWEDSRVMQFEFESSGSTGKPKTIYHSRDAIKASVNRTESFFNWKNEHFLCPLPVNKTGGRMMLFRALVLKLPILFVEPSLNPFLHLDSSVGFTSTSVSPQQLYAALSNEMSLQRLFQIGHVLIGGAPLTPSLKNRFLELELLRNVDWFHTFGMTETLSHVAVNHIGKDPENQYRTLPGIEWEVLPDGRLKVADGWFNVETTDLVSRVDDQSFHWEGRTDDVVNTGGVKVSLIRLRELIDPLFSEMGIKRQFALIGEQDSDWGERIVLVVEGTPFQDLKFIEEYLNRNLPKYHAPKRTVFIPDLPLSASGKMDRTRLNELI